VVVSIAAEKDTTKQEIKTTVAFERGIGKILFLKNINSNIKRILRRKSISRVRGSRVREHRQRELIYTPTPSVISISWVGASGHPLLFGSIVGEAIVDACLLSRSPFFSMKNYELVCTRVLLQNQRI